MISFLQDYLSINTSHPNPDYHAVCALFKTHAEHDGFEYHEIILPSGNPVIIISYYGTNPTLPSLVLNHHMDVVPALNTEKWTTPPFAGTITHGVIIGRGVQDMKGVGVIHYYALKTLKEEEIKPTRTIHMVIVPDEEIGGFTGTKEFLETEFFKKMNVGFVLDEGVASGDTSAINIKVTERKPLQIQISVTGTLTHGSKLNCFNAAHELTKILHTIVNHHEAEQKKSTAQHDGLLSSFNITSFNAGTYHEDKKCLNIVPDCASATIDIRVAPAIPMQETIDFIENILKEYKNSSYTIVATTPDQSYTHYETTLYNTVAQTIKNYGLSAQPLFFEGASDLRYYKALGIDGVGLTPFTTNDELHCTNESLPVTDLIQGKNIMIHFLKNFCVNKENING